MARAVKNVLTKGTSGTVGDIITFTRKKSGKQIIGAARGPSTTPPTPAQLEVRNRFRISTIYAKAAIKDPATKAIYEAVIHGDETAYNLALRDAFKAPEIVHIDTAAYAGHEGDTIVVRAIDDFKVVSVTVEIRNGAGGFLEEGNALPHENGLDWVFTAIAENPVLPGTRITAKARDLPVNETVKDVLL